MLTQTPPLMYTILAKNKIEVLPSVEIKPASKQAGLTILLNQVIGFLNRPLFLVISPPTVSHVDPVVPHTRWCRMLSCPTDIFSRWDMRGVAFERF